MFPHALTEVLLQVITSWQVIAVTLALIVFISLVSYVARSYHRPRAVSKAKPKSKPKPQKEAAAPADGIEDTDMTNIGDEADNDKPSRGKP